MVCLSAKELDTTSCLISWLGRDPRSLSGVPREYPLLLAAGAPFSSCSVSIGGYLLMWLVRLRCLHTAVKRLCMIVPGIGCGFASCGKFLSHPPLRRERKLTKCLAILCAVFFLLMCKNLLLRKKVRVRDSSGRTCGCCTPGEVVLLPPNRESWELIIVFVINKMYADRIYSRSFLACACCLRQEILYAIGE